MHLCSLLTKENPMTWYASILFDAPKLDGTRALKAIRDVEKQRGIEGDSRVKVIMTTALNDTTNVYNAFDSGCEAYAAKPIDTKKFTEVLKRIGLISECETK